MKRWENTLYPPGAHGQKMRQGILNLVHAGTEHLANARKTSDPHIKWRELSSADSSLFVARGVALTMMRLHMTRVVRFQELKQLNRLIPVVHEHHMRALRERAKLPW